jgi:hypothetical protein
MTHKVVENGLENNAVQNRSNAGKLQNNLIALFDCTKKFAHRQKIPYICSLFQFTIFSLIFQRKAA